MEQSKSSPAAAPPSTSSCMNDSTLYLSQHVCYCLVNNIPGSFHTSDLRNFFSEFIQGEKFDLFHFRHRPQTVDCVDKNSESLNKSKQDNGTKKMCCPVRFSDGALRDSFVRRYHSKFWMDKEGNDLPAKCIITKVSLNVEDLKRFANKELHPPKFMPRGNVGTSNSYYLNLIRECRLPPSLIKKLGLEFPRARVFKRYSKVPPPPTLNRGTRLLPQQDQNSEDDEEVKTGKGHSISDTFVPLFKKRHSEVQQENQKKDSDNESNADDDDDRCEEWERHEALHNHRTTHGDVTSESKERLYEQEIELQWEKGGPGIVWYTDAQFWDQQRGSFDEKTSDDWDVDMEGYYEAGAGDKDAHDLMDMRRSERVRNGLETISVIKAPAPPKPAARKIRVQLGGGSNNESGKIGLFEKHTRGVGRKVMEKFGWKDGDGLGKTIKGIPDALENEGQGPGDKRGFGFYGEKLELGNQKKRQRDFKEYDIEAKDRVIIGTIYDKPEDLDTQEPLKRRNLPTFIKRYDFIRESKLESTAKKIKDK